LQVNIYDWVVYGNKTSLSSIKNRYSQKLEYTLDINLKELIDIYKNGSKEFIECNRNLPEKIRGIRKYILFVLYHESSHYILKHHENFDFYCKDRLSAEKSADLLAYNRITQGQQEFNYMEVIQ
jgi:hypothetical protein